MTSNYFRITAGTVDPHTSPTVSAILALLLENAGVNVEYKLMWNQIHTDADTENGFIDWVESICR